MSLANLIIQQPAGHLITDSGWFGRGGRVVELKPKVLAFPALSLAFTARGQHEMLAALWQELQAFERARGSITGGDVVAAFSELYSSACAVHRIPLEGRRHACEVQLVHYCAATRRATGYLIANIVTDLPGLTPFTLTPVTCVASGKIDMDAPFGATIDVGDPAAFDMRRDGARLADVQRRDQWECPPFPRAHYVAGTIHLTTVGPAGVTVEPIAHYPDEIGQLVQPDRADAA